MLPLGDVREFADMCLQKIHHCISLLNHLTNVQGPLPSLIINWMTDNILTQTKTEIILLRPIGVEGNSFF